MAENPRPREIHICDIQQGRSHVIPVHLTPIDGADYGKEHESCGEYAECAANAKVSQADGGSPLMLLQQKVRDQITGENKENVDAKVAVTADVGEWNVLPLYKMTENDQGDGNGPQTIERWYSMRAHAAFARPCRARFSRLIS